MLHDSRIIWILFSTFFVGSSFFDNLTANGNVVPAYIWPLAYIYNQTLPVTPPMEVYGNVKQASENGGLQFDGQSGWIDAGNFEGLSIIAVFDFYTNENQPRLKG